MIDDGQLALAGEIGGLLRELGLTVAVAESCTGGLAGHYLTSVSGSSDYFKGGVTAYSNEVKKSQLGVGEKLLAEKGAVSEEVAGAMADGVKDRLRSDIGIGITGIAGPAGGTFDKPVGLVFVAVAGGGKTGVKRFQFSGDRGEVKEAAAGAALKMLKRFGQEQKEEGK